MALPRSKMFPAQQKIGAFKRPLAAVLPTQPSDLQSWSLTAPLPQLYLLILSRKSEREERLSLYFREMKMCFVRSTITPCYTFMQWSDRSGEFISICKLHEIGMPCETEADLHTNGVCWQQRCNIKTKRLWEWCEARSRSWDLWVTEKLSDNK